METKVVALTIGGTLTNEQLRLLAILLTDAVGPETDVSYRDLDRDWHDAPARAENDLREALDVLPAPTFFADSDQARNRPQFEAAINYCEEVGLEYFKRDDDDDMVTRFTGKDRTVGQFDRSDQLVISLDLIDQQMQNGTLMQFLEKMHTINTPVPMLHIANPIDTRTGFINL